MRGDTHKAVEERKRARETTGYQPFELFRKALVVILRHPTARLRAPLEQQHPLAWVVCTGYSFRVPRSVQLHLLAAAKRKGNDVMNSADFQHWTISNGPQPTLDVSCGQLQLLIGHSQHWQLVIGHSQHWIPNMADFFSFKLLDSG